MSHKKKLFWTLLLVVLSLSGGLIFAFGRGLILHVESNQKAVSETNNPTETSGTVRQRDFNRYHDLTVEISLWARMDSSLRASPGLPDASC